MSFFTLLSDQAMFTRYLQLVALMPLILRQVELAEQSSQPGSAKRAHVVEMTSQIAREMQRRGYLPSDALEELQKVAGDLTDGVITVYNASGYFKKGKRPKVKDE